MSVRSPSARRLPILPLLDEVHFPRTELRLHVVDEEYGELVRELFEREGDESRVGTVLLMPDEEDFEEEEEITASDLEGGDLGDPNVAERAGEARLLADREPDFAAEATPYGLEIPRLVVPAVYAAGTAARLISVVDVDEGCEIVLRGEFRFELEEEIAAGPGRYAWVRPMEEPDLAEDDPDVLTLRREIVGVAVHLAGELGERFALDGEQLREFASDLPFEAMINHLAANMDVAPLRKLQLLRTALPDRALHLLTILRGRRQVLDMLRPYRHLARCAELN
jgi:Lon protease-like protein